MEGNLPSTLLFLQIFNHTSDFDEVDNILESLTSFGRLQDLKLHWKLYDGHYFSLGFYWVVQCIENWITEFKNFPRKSANF